MRTAKPNLRALSLLTLAILALIVTGCAPRVAPTPTPQETVYNTCKKEALIRLGSPSTAKFQPFDPSLVQVGSVMNGTGQGWRANFYVDSQGSNGGMVRSSTYCEVDPQGKITRIWFVTQSGGG